METCSVKFYKHNRSYNNKTLAELKGNTRATLFIHAGQYPRSTAGKLKAVVAWLKIHQLFFKKHSK